MASKSVGFIPLSPKSSKTMRRHQLSQIEVTESEVEPNESEAPRKYDGVPERPQVRRRRSSDPTADRPLTRRRRRGQPSIDSESEEDVEELPERFDTQGRPLDGRDRGDGPRWTSRGGDFHRRPRKPGDADIRGSWHVGGTDGIAVDKLARSFTEALDGRKSWMGVLGEALGGSGLLGQPERPGLRDRRHDEDSGYGPPRRKGS